MAKYLDLEGFEYYHKHAVQPRLDTKVAGAYIEQTDEGDVVYLTNEPNGEGDVVVGPLGPFSGGGGGGGSAAGSVITIQKITSWASTTISQSSTCPVTINWTSVENEVPTGDGTLVVAVDGVTKLTMNVAQGQVGVDVAPYLAVGTNVVTISVFDIYGKQAYVRVRVTVVELTISSTFDASSAFTGDITFVYTPNGAVSKVVHFVLDGTEIGTVTTTSSGRQMSYVIDAQEHGSHLLQCYMTSVIGEETIQSNTLTYDLICVESGETDPIIASSFNTTTVEQYVSTPISFSVYNPVSLTNAIKISIDNVVVSEQTVDRTEQTYTYRPSEVGTHTIVIAALIDSDLDTWVTKTFTLTVTQSTIDVEAETEDLKLFLTSYGRSNNESNPGTWVYTDETSGDTIAATFSNFNFTSDGWLKDDDGITVLRVAGDARVTIPYQIFAEDFRTTGKTLEFEFATRDVMNYDSVILSCFSNNRGIQITSQKALMKSEQSEISTQFKEDEHVRISFVVEKRAENRLILIYINGIMSGAVQYPEQDNFQQSDPVGISIGSNDSTIDLYCIRAYDNNLTRHVMLDNWIADTQDGATMLDRYNHNNVYNEYDQITIANLPNDLPYLRIDIAELPQYKGDKKTCSGEYVDPVDDTRSFTFSGAQIDVQGTSSQYYARKNYKIKFKNGFVMTKTGATSSTFQIAEDTVPVSTFCFKADVASSEGANNVELVRLYDHACPYKTPAQLEDSRVRQGIDGFPIVIFHNHSGTVDFVG